MKEMKDWNSWRLLPTSGSEGAGEGEGLTVAVAFDLDILNRLFRDLEGPAVPMAEDSSLCRQVYFKRAGCGAQWFDIGCVCLESGGRGHTVGVLGPMHGFPVCKWYAGKSHLSGKGMWNSEPSNAVGFTPLSSSAPARTRPMKTKHSRFCGLLGGLMVWRRSVDRV